jgi:hypothetical protein
MFLTTATTTTTLFATLNARSPASALPHAARASTGAGEQP